MADHKTIRNGGQLLMDCLISLGAEQGFGVPGESYLAVLDAMYDRRHAFRFTCCRQEGGAAYMADAWGKLTGEPGICFVTRGPGATNASIGIHSALQGSSPMILFIGQVATGDRDREAFQEIDYRAFFSPIAKWATEIDRAERIPEIVNRAWTIALSGRPGPVVVGLPEDMLRRETNAQPCRSVRIGEPSPGADEMTEAAKKLQAAKRPLILIGGGRWNDEGKAAIRAFAETNNLPVAVVFRFHDLIGHDSPAYVGEAGVGMAPYMKAILSGCDLLLAVNTRFGEMTTDAYTLFKPPQMDKILIHVHASDREIGKIYNPDLPVHAGPNQFAKALAAMGKIGDWSGWLEKNRKDRAAAREIGPQPGTVDMGAVIAWLDEHLAADAIVTNGAGNFATWPGRLIQYTGSRRLLAPQSGTMGYGLPAAIAAKKRYPDRQVVCFAGDGDFQMNCQELGTAAQEGAQPIVILLNNGSYGTIRMHQERQYPGRIWGTEIANPDFVALAQAYGFSGERVARTEDFATAFKRAANSPSGALIEIVMSLEAILPGKTMSDVRNEVNAA